MIIANKNYLDNKSIDILLALLLNLIIFSTNNIFMMYTKHLSLLFVLVNIVNFLILERKDLTIKINKFKGLYLAFFSLICFDFVYIVNVGTILEYMPYLILGLFIIFVDYKKTFYYYFLKIFKIIFWIFICSMYLDALIPSVFSMLFSFMSFGDAAMRSLTSGGAIAGLAFEKAYAAFVCNLGLGVILAELVLKKSLKSTAELILVMIALMMTGKRTLFIIPIIIIFVYIILFSKNNKFIKFAVAGLAIALSVLVIYLAVPGAGLIIDRLINSQGDLLSGRENFWNYALEMFHQSPVLGKGFLSFNDYVYKQGFRYYGDKWNYQAHNVYLQLLGETGVIGFCLVVGLILLLLAAALVWAKKNRNFWSVLLVYWIILFTIYSLTGNTIYYPCQLIILFLAVLFISNEKKLEDIRYKRNRTIKLKF